MFSDIGRFQRRLWIEDEIMNVLKEWEKEHLGTSNFGNRRLWRRKAMYIEMFHLKKTIFLFNSNK